MKNLTNPDQISQLLDGELEQSAVRFTLKRLKNDAEARDYWQRMHLLRHTLRDGETVKVPADFLQGIQIAITNEEAPEGVSTKRTLVVWLKPLTGLAVAASVAMLALFGINQHMLQAPIDQPGAGLLADTIAPVETSESFVTRNNALEYGLNAQVIPVSFSEDPLVERRRLNKYLLRHSQVAAGSGHVGFISYIPLVSGDIKVDENLTDKDNSVTTKVQIPEALKPSR